MSFLKVGFEAAFPQGGRAGGMINAIANALRIKPGVKVAEGVAKPKVVVIGSGWGGFQCLEQLDARLFDISVVSTRDHMCFTPLLAGAATGALSLPAVAQPIRESLIKRDGHFHLARADEVDVEKKTVRVQPVLPKRVVESHFGGHRSRFRNISADDDFPAYDIPYDFLVMSPGMVPHSFGIEGVEEYCYTLKYVTDAMRVRSKIVALFDRAAHPNVCEATKKQLLSFVVCGGGPTGVEFTAELLDLVNRCAKQNFNLHQYVSVTLVEGARVLGSFTEGTAEYTVETLKKRNVNVMLGERVSKVTDTEIFLGDNKKIPYGFCLWSAGNKAVRLVDNAAFMKSRGGRILVNDNLQVKDYPEIYVIGDAAEIEGSPLPPTAQIASQQGTYVATRLNQSSHNDFKEAPWEKHLKFSWANKGQMAFVGKKVAVLETPGKHKPFSFKGVMPWMVWKGFYFGRQFSARNRIIIAADWIRTAMFGRTMMRW